MRILLKILAWMSVLGFIVVIAAGAGAYLVYWHFGRDLPDHEQLAKYEPPVATRVYAGDGRLMAEYAREHRLFVPIEAVPPRVIHAFLAAEDAEFYEHPGVDLKAIARAVIQNVKNYGQNRRPVGASTITQQVAKNFLLTNEVSITRKIKEAILALRIEKAFSKDHILELYLNEIYLGQGAYGVASAALTYFDKPLDELTVDEAAFLAALPKAPNNYNPYRNNARAKARRDWVIERMAVENMIDPRTAEAAMERPLEATRQREVELVQADWFAEEVRRTLKDSYGDDGLYSGGLSVQTTVDPELQRIAQHHLREGLVAYDRRHGYRGPFGKLSDTEMADWTDAVTRVEPPKGAPNYWKVAVVLEAAPQEARLGLVGGQEIAMPLERLSWAREPLDEGKRGPAPNRTSDVFERGDLVFIGPDTEDPDKPQLRQIPKIDGAVVAMDPHTGRVLALVGGFSSERSEFNRATQAARQPGSAFKPIVYAAALENGFTPASIILDAPFVIDQGAGLGKWKPSNYSNRFYGPSTLRLGLEKSRNLMTVRLAQTMGMDTVADYAERFGVYDDMPQSLSYALGAGETTLLRLTTAYAMLVNGGKRVDPTLIDRVQDRRGATLYSHDALNCGECDTTEWTDDAEPVLADRREQVVRQSTAYQMVSLLEGVVKRGTGVRVSSVGKPLAGKTGTTNDSRDTWFVGFSPDLALGVFAGFDEPAPLGKGETGSSVSAPVFRDIMAEYLKDKPTTPFRVPPDIRLVRIDGRSGTPVSGSGPNVILEAFKTEQERRALAAARGAEHSGGLAGRSIDEASLGQPASASGALGDGTTSGALPANDNVDKLPVRPTSKANKLVDGVY